MGLEPVEHRSTTTGLSTGVVHRSLLGDGLRIRRRLHEGVTIGHGRQGLRDLLNQRSLTVHGCLLLGRARLRGHEVGLCQELRLGDGIGQLGGRTRVDELHALQFGNAHIGVQEPAGLAVPDDALQQRIDAQELDVVGMTHDAPVGQTPTGRDGITNELGRIIAELEVQHAPSDEVFDGDGNAGLIETRGAGLAVDGLVEQLLVELLHLENQVELLARIGEAAHGVGQPTPCGDAEVEFLLVALAVFLIDAEGHFALLVVLFPAQDIGGGEGQTTKDAGGRDDGGTNETISCHDEAPFLPILGRLTICGRNALMRGRPPTTIKIQYESPRIPVITGRVFLIVRHAEAYLLWGLAHCSFKHNPD